MTVAAANRRKYILDAYRDLMVLTAGRVIEVQQLAAKFSPQQRIFDIEVAALHVRKMCESIALGSLIAHTAAFTRLSRRHKRVHSLDALIRDVEKLNQNWLPIPFEKRRPEPPAGAHLIARPDLALTRNYLLAAFNASSEIVHQQNFLHERGFSDSKCEILYQFADKLMWALSQHFIELAPSGTILGCSVQFFKGGLVEAFFADSSGE